MKPTIIFDDRRPPDFIEQMWQQGIGLYDVFPAITDRKTVVECISASHRAIVAIAKHREEPYCVIMEDDIMFTAPGAWLRFLSLMPEDYDLYLGGCYGPVEDGITHVPVGFHCYAVHERYYDTFLDTDPTKHIDATQKGGIYKVCYPMVALQRPGFSWNNKADVDYNKQLKSEDIWKS